MADLARSAGSGEGGQRIIRRPRLLRLLASTQSRRILLVAPAGYGKTTLAGQWITEGSRRGVWFRATSASSDVAALASGLAKVTEGVVQGGRTRVQERLRKSQSPDSEAEELGVILGESLSTWPEDVWIVIDDYHHLAVEPAAEHFVDSVARASDVPLLVTSRVRPAWASAKRLLYGDITEFGRNVLAMTHEEAAEAVARGNATRQTLAGLVALADGWPAVIGLASLVQSPTLVSDYEIPEALHSYLAEELYQDIDDDLRQALLKLSLAPSISSDLVSTLPAMGAPAVLERAYERGFLNKEGELYDLHPLVRQFLRTKLSHDNQISITDTARAIARFYIGQSHWDEAFALVNEFDLHDLFGELLERSLDELLQEGRLATLEQWVAAAQRLIPEQELVRLVEVELAFRRARWPEAEEKARLLAKRLEPQHPLASRALFRAAQAAQLDDRQHDALELLDEARVRAGTPADLRRVVWSRFITLTDLEEREQAAAALDEFAKLPPESVNDAIRLSQGAVHFALRWGGIREQLERQRATLKLLEGTVDPVARSGFLQSYSTALTLAARYEEAHDLATRQIEDARRFGLDWVGPHALELRALTQIGTRDFSRARVALNEALRAAQDTRDLHAQINAIALLARIPLMQGEPSRAFEILHPLSERGASPGMAGEFTSMRALALACMNRLEEAEDEIAASEAITSHLEARGLRAFARAVVAELRGDEAEAVRALKAALDEASVTGNADAFVCAYRAHPHLLQTIGDVELPLEDFLLRPLQRYDAGIAAKAGLTRRAARPSRQGLTDRESEVLGLLRQGLSNRQIARALWISESTVKVHVRHVFEKLGVHSRTEAALFSEKEPA